MRLAYLCNRYPAVSHSFVRREIEAIEAAGFEVHRFSIRPAHGDLRDEGDLREARITQPVLARGIGPLLGSALLMTLARPSRALSAAAAALRLSAPGLRSKALHAVYWLEAAWLARRLRKAGVEHLHVHFGTNPAAVALLTEKFGGPPFSLTIHGPDEFDAPIALSVGKKVAAARFVAAISSYCRSQLMRWSRPEDWAKIGIVRCGVSDDFLNAEAMPAAASSTEFVCVARLSAQKGLPLLLAACDRLRHSGQQFSVTIIGDGELWGELERDILERGLQDHVTLAGIRSAAEIREHLQHARAFVLPSFAEGLPVVLMEALVLSRPVITTAIAGIPELVDKECGWLIPAGSEEALAEAMSEALHASPEELAAKGSVGRERVRRMHDARRNALAIVDAIAAERARLVS